MLTSCRILYLSAAKIIDISYKKQRTDYLFIVKKNYTLIYSKTFNYFINIYISNHINIDIAKVNYLFNSYGRGV